MPVIDLSTSVLVAGIYETWMRLPLICEAPLVRALSLERREHRAADAEGAAIANARARYNTHF